MMYASLQSTLIFSGTFEGMQFGVCISEMSCDVTGSGSQVVLAQELCRTAKHSLWKPSRTSQQLVLLTPLQDLPGKSQTWKTSAAAHSALIFIFDKKLLHLTQQDRCISESLEALQVWAASVRGRKATRARHRETSEYSSFLAKSFGLRCLEKLHLELASKLLMSRNITESLGKHSCNALSIS